MYITDDGIDWLIELEDEEISFLLGCLRYSYRYHELYDILSNMIKEIKK